jgi:HD-like signal output (HDOD) protein
VIEQVCSLQDILSAPEIRKIVGSVGELPSLSITYTRLMKAVNDPNTSIGQVAEIIEDDVAMSAKILQLANSAFFGLAQEVTSLPVAATYLGMATIKNLALVSESFRVFVPGPRIPQSVCESMQRHSQHAASIASMLPVDSGIRDVTILAAFLHDIGSLFLASAMPDSFCAILARANERGCKLFEAEEELLGTSHAEIGAYLLGLWGIPNLAVEAIAHHHHPTRISHSGMDSTVAVYIADLLAHEWDAHPQGSTGPEIEESDRACLEMLGVLPIFTEFRELAQQTRD